MPPISIPNFQLPDDAKAAAGKSPPEMVDAAFRSLGPWFAGIINVTERQWQTGVSAKDDKIDTQLRLGRLVGQVTQMKDLLLQYVNGELRPRPGISIDDFKLPREATTDGKLIAPEMIGKAFQSLKPFFDCIIGKIKPYYAKTVAPDSSRQATQVRLGGLEGTVNMLKGFFQKFVNDQIARKESGQCFSAGGVGDADVTENIGQEVLSEVLNIDVGDNPDISIDEDVAVDVDDSLFGS